MPTIGVNRREWSVDYDWSRGGDEWSHAWGGTPALWYGTILPRIHAFLPAATILEIGPGFGRWTQYLRVLCKRLIVVDVAEPCIAACRERFSDSTNIEYHVNDGTSLAMIPPCSIDLVFSFDSLVHAEKEVIDAYLGQLAEKLNPDGIGFLHHSNLGACLNGFTKRLFPLNKLLRYSWRAESMSARHFAEYAAAVDLCCPSQELVNWGSPNLGEGAVRREIVNWGMRLPLPTDCFSVIAASDSPWAGHHRVFKNMRFMSEARQLARIAACYGPYDIRMPRGRQVLAGV